MNWLVKLGIYAIEVMFVIGMAGAALVLVLSAIEDVQTLTERDTPEV